MCLVVVSLILDGHVISESERIFGSRRRLFFREKQPYIKSNTAPYIHNMYIKLWHEKVTSKIILSLEPTVASSKALFNILLAPCHLLVVEPRKTLQGRLAPIILSDDYLSLSHDSHIFAQNTQWKSCLPARLMSENINTFCYNLIIEGGGWMNFDTYRPNSLLPPPYPKWSSRRH
jgi:hypothetical protein